MGKIMQFIIIVIAVLIAYLLSFLGIKRIKIKESRTQGLFITTLFIVLSLMGYDYTVVAEETTTMQRSTMKEVTPRSARIDELNKTQEWQELKTLAPKQMMDASKILDHERNLHLSVINLLNKLMKEKKLISPRERVLLEKTIRSRWYSLAPIRTRMMRPPQIEREDIMDNLKKQTQKLTELLKEEKIDNQEFQNALLNMKGEADAFTVIGKSVKVKEEIKMQEQILKENKEKAAFDELVRDLFGYPPQVY